MVWIGVVSALDWIYRAIEEAHAIRIAASANFCFEGLLRRGSYAARIAARRPHAVSAYPNSIFKFPKFVAAETAAGETAGGAHIVGLQEMASWVGFRPT